MLGAINLKSFTNEQVKVARAASSCHRYLSPVINEAPERIARLAGYQDYEEMSLSYELHFNAGRMVDIPASFYPIYLSAPDNYKKTPRYYRAVEITLDLLFGHKLKESQGIQLASNYGPFLAYLQEQRGISGLIGVDTDPIAVQYAEQNGLPVIKADVRTLPFPDYSQDVVISGLFLDPWYLRIIADFSGYGRGEEEAFLKDVLSETYRVLKPGGCLISLHEWFVHPNEKKTEWHPFSRSQFFSQEAINDFLSLEDIAVLQKPSQP